MIVVGRQLVGPEASIARVERRGRPAATTMLDADDFERFQRSTVSVPAVPAYLLTDVSSGRETPHVTPDDALAMVDGRGARP